MASTKYDSKEQIKFWIYQYIILRNLIAYIIIIYAYMDTYTYTYIYTTNFNYTVIHHYRCNSITKKFS
jgi:hypothetical protein